jgi:DNA-binding transcriptional LysR family regulator
MEERLGVKLVHRTTRRVTLTDTGRRYLDAAERIVAEFEEAETAASVDRLEPRGTLRVNVPVSFGAREIAPLLPEFARLYPSLIVDLGLNDRVVDLIEEGWDMAVRVGRVAESTMIVRKLAPCGAALCAAPAYLAQKGIPRSVTDLKDHNCLGYTLSQTLGSERWSFGADGAVTVPVTGKLRANNGDALVAAAVAGQGLIYQPTFLVSTEIRAGRLICLALDHPAIELPGVFALYPADPRPPAKVRAFIDFLAKRFGSVPPWHLSKPEVPAKG